MKKKKSFGHILWGVLFIAAAGLIVLHLLGLLGELGLWTLLISVPITIGAIHSLVKRQWSGLFFSLAILVFIYRRHIEQGVDISINLWALFGIATLLSIGFHILFGKRGSKVDIPFIHVGHGDFAGAKAVDGEKVYFAESFTGTSKYIHSSNLSYVSIQNSFGGMEVHFNQAQLADEGAIVDLKNSFGGVDLFIPRHWNVSLQVSSFLGGVDCPQKPWVEGAPTIIIQGSNSFGGVDVEFV